MMRVVLMIPLSWRACAATLFAVACLATPARARAQMAGAAPAGAPATAPSQPAVYRGAARELTVRAPRMDADVVVDGVLNEAAWATSAVLTAFSQFTPQDGVPAEDSTRVMVWYSPTAIYFGIRAYQPAGTVRATLADRDRISNDDNIQILLGTFNDRRQATVLMVNPLGVQADGNLVERGSAQGGGFLSTSQASRESADLSPDFVYASKGRVTDFGYEVEIRVPFKSLRFQAGAVQAWDLNVVRQAHFRGYEYSWAPARRASASFLAQGGTIEGIMNIRRGLVMDFTPEVTQRTEGRAAAAPADGWRYEADRPSLGGNVRWGMTNNLNLNGTINPDFSHVEADATPVQFDPRQAISFPEKRPFFLDGSEQFAVPSGLVYSRRIVQPVVAAKVAGKSGANGIAILSAVDAKSASATGRDHPVYNIVRLQRDLGDQSRIGMAYTDKVDGANSNRVLDVDGRMVWDRVNSVQYQLAGSLNRAAGTEVAGPLWDLRYNRSGRNLAIRASFRGISDRFITQSGFIARTGQTQENVGIRFTGYGKRGARVEQYALDLMGDGLWDYRNWLNRGDARDKKLHITAQAQFRGGWSGSTALLVETFGYDPAFYGPRYRVLVPRAGGLADTLPFVGTPRLPNRDWSLSLASPRLKYATFSSTVIYGVDENFAEWSSADIWYVNLSADIRPTDQLRIQPSYVLQDFWRRTNHTRVQQARLPRLRVEYQVTRDLFVRAIGEYAATFTDSLFDDSRTGGRLLIRNSAGTWVPTVRRTANNVRGELLVSYRPTPGTVFYAGYTSLMREPDAFRFTDLNRASDAVFVKASYLIRR